MKLVKDTPDDCVEPLKRTMDNYERLVDLIEKRLDMASNGA